MFWLKNWEPCTDIFFHNSLKILGIIQKIVFDSYFYYILPLKLSTMQLETAGGNHCCLMAIVYGQFKWCTELKIGKNETFYCHSWFKCCTDENLVWWPIFFCSFYYSICQIFNCPKLLFLILKKLKTKWHLKKTSNCKIQVSLKVIWSYTENSQ